MSNRAELILSLRDEISSGMAKINASLAQTRQAVEGLGGAGKQSFDGQGTAAEAYSSSLLKQIGVYALVIGAAYKLEQTAVAAFKAGIQAVDDYKLSTIGVAATLADMAQDQGKGQENYTRALAYSKDMYQELELAAARYFASGKEMTQAWNILAQKGIVLRKDEIDSLGVIVDRIKLSTQGQVSGIQIAQEMRALLTGQARVTDQIGLLLKDRIPNLEQEIAKHRQIGDLVQWLGSQFKGLSYASQDIQGTLESQKSTLDTLLTQVGRGGLTGAYGDIVGILQEVNGYLLTHKEEISGGIARGWQGVKELVNGTLLFVKDIVNIAKKGIVIPITFSIGGLSKFLASGGQVEGGKYLAGGQEAGLGLPGIPQKEVYISPQTAFGFGAEFMDLGAAYRPKYSTPEQSAALRVQVGGQIVQTPEGPITMFGEETLTPATTQKPGDGKGGGGGGAGKALEAAERSLENFVQRMKSETAKASGEGMAALGEWYSKSSLELDRITGKVGESLDARRALKDAYNSKALKIEQEFQSYVAKESGNAYTEIEAQSNKWLQKVGGNIDHVMQLWDIKSRKEWELDVKNHTERLGLEKSFYDQAAGLAVDLTDQVGLRREALSREIEIQRYQLAVQLEHLTVAKKITGEERDRYLANQSLLAQQKRFNFEMENNKGLSGWAYNRVKSESQKNTWADAMEGLEGFVNEAWTQGAQGALGKVKVDVIELGKTFALSAALSLGKQGIHKLFTGAAESILGLAGGPNKPAGTATNPYYVVQVGGQGEAGEAAYQRSVTAAGKTGMTLGGGGLSSGAKGFSFTDQYFKKLEKGESKFDRVFTSDLNDWNNKLKVLTKTGDTYNDLQGEWAKDNQDAFNTEYLGQYQTDFTGMTAGITNAWGMAQGLMTAAGASGEAQRYATMAQYGIQGVSLLYNIVAKGTLMKAWAAGASAYSSTWEFLGFPLAVAVAPIMAAVAFAGTLMAGSGGGGGGGGGGGDLGASGIATAHDGLLVAHNGLLVAHNGLANDERLVKVLTGEPILRREAMAAYTNMGVTFDDLNNARLPMRPVAVGSGSSGGNGTGDNRQVHFHFHKGAIQIPIQDNGMTQQKAEQIVSRFILPALQKKAGNRGLSFLE